MLKKFPRATGTQFIFNNILPESVTFGLMLKNDNVLRCMHTACWLAKATITLRILNSYFFYSATIVTGMRLIVSLYVHCLCCYVMSLVIWTFFRTQELGLSLQVPVSWNERLISNLAELTRQLASHFVNVWVLLFLFANRRDEHPRRVGSWFIFYYFYFCEITTSTHDTLCALIKFHS
jgi:hypothetical protein